MEKAARSSQAADASVLKIAMRHTPEQVAAALTSLRTRQLPTGRISLGRTHVAESINGILTSNVLLSGKAEAQYRRLALSFSRLAASYVYEDDGKSLIREINPSLVEGFLILSAYLQKETVGALEIGITRPYQSLSKFSLTEIKEMIRYLKCHKDHAARSNAMTILNTALERADPALLRTLADGAEDTHSYLLRHADPMVRSNAKTILSLTLIKGDLAKVGETINDFAIKRARRQS